MSPLRMIWLRLTARWDRNAIWQRGYLAGMDAGLRRAEARQARGERIR